MKPDKQETDANGKNRERMMIDEENNISFDECFISIDASGMRQSKQG